MPKTPRSSAKTDQKVELAKRLRLLIDAWEIANHKPLQFPEVSAYLKQRDIQISRPRWSYMINGSGFLSSDPRLLTALAELFDTDAAFLSDLTSSIPAALEPRLSEVRALRIQQLEQFASDNLDLVANDLLDKISRAIRSVS